MNPNAYALRAERIGRLFDRCLTAMDRTGHSGNLRGWFVHFDRAARLLRARLREDDRLIAAVKR